MKAKAEIKNLAKFCFVLGIIFNASAGQATSAPTIDRADIIPSTTLPILDLGGGPAYDFNINKLNDGITEPFYTQEFGYNGFASSEPKGTITFDFVKEFDLSSFILWNDVNVQQEGIKNFHLDFFDKSNNLISSSTNLVAPLGQIASEEYTFGKVIPAVSRVNLVVSDSYDTTFNRIEIREVEFTGTPSAKSVPEPTSALALGAFVGFGILVNKKKRKQLS
jgi:hypothetical protein